MKGKSSHEKPISSYFSTNKNISLLVRNPKKRKQFEDIFKFKSVPQDQNEFLEEFSKLEGPAGEWKFLSEKFKNESLKKAAVERFKQEIAKNSSGAPATKEAEPVLVTKPKDSIWKVLSRYFLGFLSKKPST